jgi:hypothetical protein
VPVTETFEGRIVWDGVVHVFDLTGHPKAAMRGAISDGSSPCSKAIAAHVARLEPYGLPILIGLLIILPMLGAQLGVDLSFLSHLIAIAAGAIVEAIVHVTGNS